jgi:deoxyribonuclease-4
MSIAGGVHKAVERAAEVGCECVQIFTKNNNQWRAAPISDEQAELFRDKLKETGVAHPMAHSSYLINLASPDEGLWKKSVDALVVEMQRGEQLGLHGVVLHPGAHTTATEQEGLANVVRALDQMHKEVGEIQCRCLLETTAGQGSNLGWRFEQLAQILGGVRRPERLGVCVDTCHIFAAGYSLETADEYDQTIRELDRLVGLDRIAAFHLNDSKRELGSRVDRHEHIGSGCLGLEPFRHLLNDRRFEGIPMYLETPKGTQGDEDWDRINLRTLRELFNS